MADILADYRLWRSRQEDRIGTHAPDCHLWPRHERCMIHRLAGEVERLRALADRRGEIAVDRRREIERLRLTDDERQAIRWIVGDDLSADGVSIQATLRGLLERHAPGTYRKNDKNAPVSDTIRGVTEPLPKEKRA